MTAQLDDRADGSDSRSQRDTGVRKPGPGRHAGCHGLPARRWDAQRRMSTPARLVPALLAASILLASCTSSAASGRKPSTSTTTTEAVPPVALTAPPPWTPTADEPVPEVKTVAARLVQTLTTYPFRGGTVAAAAARLRAAGFSDALVSQAGPLLVPDTASAGTVVYPQLAGFSPGAASVMVVTRQLLRSAKADRVVTRTIDVELTFTGGAWQPAGVASTGGDAPRSSVPAANVAALLANPRVALPDTARWDLMAGRIDGRITDLLLSLAGTHRLAVTVLSTGHPRNVFGTNRVSNHTAGRGVDIWALDGRPVAASRQPGSPVEQLVREVIAAGVTEVGSPFDVDGRGGPSFTNVVHQDHLHLAFKR